MSDPGDLLFTILVATYNGARCLPRTLESLLDQTFPRARYEIVVVDDGSQQDVEAVARRYPVRFLRLDGNCGVAAARNAGAQLARGRVVVGFDDDCLADPDWLEQLSKAFYDRPDVVGAGGILVHGDGDRSLLQEYFSAKEAGTPPPKGQTPAGSPWRRLKAYIATHAPSRVPAADGIVEVCELYGANSAFVLHALRAVGGWDESMSGIEDTDLSRRLLEAYPDATFLCLPRARVHHRPDMNVRRLLRRGYHRGPVTWYYYRRNGFVPPLFPWPPLVAVGYAAGLMLGSWTTAALVALVLPQLLYGWWWPRAVVARDVRYLVFPYLQLVDETAIQCGLARGALQTVTGAVSRRFVNLRCDVTKAISRRRLGVTPEEVRAHRNGPDVWLTFDDYGSCEQVTRILDILADEDVRAIFFPVGEWAERHPDLIERMEADGHVLGNHTYSHADLLQLTDDEVADEITRGVSGELLRPPMGHVDMRVRRIAAEHGRRIAYWSVDSDDWRDVSQQYIEEKVLRECEPGSVVLFHLHAERSIRALPRIIAELRRRGLTMPSRAQATATGGGR